MSHLDDPSFVAKNDPKGMMALAEQFPDQCRRALSLASQLQLPHELSDCEQVVVLGMGGSAAGGDYLRELLHEKGTVPCIVCRDYTIPAFVSPKTLVIACSYSGATEETVSAVRCAMDQGAQIMAVTSGGELADLCEENGYPCVKIPGGQPPRTALGYLFVPIAYACVMLGYLPEQDFDGAFRLLETCRSDWMVKTESKSNPTKLLAMSLYGKPILLYGLGGWQSVVASRWKGQINENAKNMAFWHAFPELCHNEIMGWTLADKQGVDRWAVVILASGDESLRMRLRADVVRELIGSKTDLHEVHSVGSDLLSRMLSLTYFGDFVSLYLAALNEVDPETIYSINILKKRLSQA